MATLLGEKLETQTPTQNDVKLAEESGRRLTKILEDRKEAPVRLCIQPEHGPAETLSIPIPALRLLNAVLAEMANGNTVALIPIHAELTTQQAADLINVSHPFLIDQIEKGLIPYRKIGTRQRILYRDLMAYQEEMDRKRLEVLEELAALDQELGLGY